MIDNIYCYNSKLHLFSITLLQNISDLTSMKVVSFCGPTLVCVDNGTPYDRCTLLWNIKIKTLITDMYCIIFAITNIVYYYMIYKHDFTGR